MNGVDAPERWCAELVTAKLAEYAARTDVLPPPGPITTSYDPETKRISCSFPVREELLPLLRILYGIDLVKHGAWVQIDRESPALEWVDIAKVVAVLAPIINALNTRFTMMAADPAPGQPASPACVLTPSILRAALASGMRAAQRSGDLPVRVEWVECDLVEGE